MQVPKEKIRLFGNVIQHSWTFVHRDQPHKPSGNIQVSPGVYTTKRTSQRTHHTAEKIQETQTAELPRRRRTRGQGKGFVAVVGVVDLSVGRLVSCVVLFFFDPLFCTFQRAAPTMFHELSFPIHVRSGSLSEVKM